MEKSQVTGIEKGSIRRSYKKTLFFYYLKVA